MRWTPFVHTLVLAAAETAPQIQLIPHAEGLARPTVITHAPDGTSRLFVAEQEGLIRVIEQGIVRPEPFLDLRARTQVDADCCDERGLLGLAFSPRFAVNREFYVFYTDQSNGVVISRFRAREGLEAGDPESESVLLRIEHPLDNHFGGQLAFSPVDGQLYASLGDGGGGGDPLQAGQDPDHLFAKIVRLDVDNGSTRPEIVAMGLRNAWRFSFDQATGDLYIADVGEETYEEVNFRPWSADGVSNFGWSSMEASHCFVPGCAPENFELPVFEYSHDFGCSVTGGYVYRGGAFPSLNGNYFLADFCSGRVWALSRASGEWNAGLVLESAGLNVSTFGEDQNGELYLADYLTGRIYRLAADESGFRTNGLKSVPSSNTSIPSDLLRPLTTR